MSRGDARVPYPLGVSQSITTSASSARTGSGVGAQTRHVMIYASEAAYYALGGSGVTATNTDTFIPGGSEHFIRINAGQYVAAIQSTSAGTVVVSEFAV